MKNFFSSCMDWINDKTVLIGSKIKASWVLIVTIIMAPLLFLTFIVEAMLNKFSLFFIILSALITVVLVLLIICLLIKIRAKHIIEEREKNKNT